MYCRYCGKQTDNNEGVCDACGRARYDQAQVNDYFGPVGEQPAQPQPAPQPAPAAAPAQTAPDGMTRKYGFGQALAAAIMSVVGMVFGIMSYVFSYICALVSLGKVVEVSSDYIYDWNTPTTMTTVSTGMIAAAIVFMIMSLALAIVSLVFGIKSIGRWKEAKRKGVKPVATLVLGISGTVCAGTALLFALLTVIMLAIAV